MNCWKALLLFPCISLFAGSASWNTGALSGDWNVAGNWNPATFPNGSADTATFPAVNNALTTVSLASMVAQNITLQTLTFNSNHSYLVQSGFAGNTLTFTNSPSIVVSLGNTATHEISCPMTFSAVTTVTNSSNAALTLSGAISGSTLRANGSGTVILSGSSANSMGLLIPTGSTGIVTLSKSPNVKAVGSTNIQAGTLRCAAANQFSSTNTLTMSGGVFDLNGNNQLLGAIIMTGGGTIQGSGVLSIDSSLDMTDGCTVSANQAWPSGGTISTGTTTVAVPLISGNIDPSGSALSFSLKRGSLSQDLIISGAIINSGALTKGSVDGILELQGSAPNTFTGSFSIQKGTVILNKDDAVVALPVDTALGGGTLKIGANKTGQIGSSVAITMSNTTELPTFDLNGNDVTFGALTYNAGTLSQGTNTMTLTSASAPLTIANVTVPGPIVLTGGANAVVTCTNLSGGTGILSGNVNLGGSNKTFNVSSGGGMGGDMVISSVISNGSLTKNGAGRLELSGTASNTYSGLTVLDGTLLVNKTGSGTVGVAGDIDLEFGTNGTVLQLASANRIDSASNMTINGGTFDMHGFNQTLTNLTYNGGTLNQLNAGAYGTLTLSSSATALTMRNTTISGPLVFSGNTPMIVFDTTNQGTATIQSTVNLGGQAATFNIDAGGAAFDMQITGVISNGSLVKTGTGTLLLTAANSYAGGTLVSAGTLQGNTTSLQGAITNNATLIFNQTSNGSYSGNMSGTGVLTKNGSAKLELTNTNTTGAVNLNAGQLAVNGTLAGGGSLTASPGTLLQGTGVVTKNCNIAGTLAPGNSIGTLTLVGDQTLLTGSTFEVELNTTMIDLLNITGALTIESGSTLYIIPEPGNYSSGFSRVIINTTGGRTGTFSTVTTSLPLFTPVVVYTPTTVILEANQNTFLPFTSVADKGNAGAVAKCLDSLVNQPCSNLSTVILRLRGLTSTEEIYKVLLELQPSSFTALAIAQENDTLYVENALFTRLEKSLHTCCDNQGKGKPSLWVVGLDGHTSQKRHGDEMGFIANSPGAFIGYDMPVGTGFVVGVGGGYTQSHLHWRASSNTANIQSGYGAAYMQWMGSKAYVESALMGGYNHYSTKRFIEFGNFEPIDVCARGQHGGAEGSVHMKLGMKYGCEGLVISPFAAIDYLFLHEGGFKESGAQSLNLTIDRKNSDLLSSEGGLDLSYCLRRTKGTYTPYLKLSAIRESRFFGQKESAAFLCGCHFDVKGYYPSRTLGGVAAGLNAELFNSTFSLAYQGKFTKGYNDNSLLVEYMYSF